MKEPVSDRLLSVWSGLRQATLEGWHRVLRVGLLPIIGAFVIGIVVLVSYYPDLTAGFWTDDFHLLQYVGSLSRSDFLVRSFDPRFQSFEYYRPVQSLQWRVQFVLFGGDALWYHIFQNSVHLLNCLLLFGIIGRLSRNWRAGFIGALVYSSLPVLSISVFWVAVPDPQAALFYLLAVWLWVDYLEKGGKSKLVLTLLSFVVGLLTKEMVLTLPITLLLVDRWLVAKPARLKKWVARNVPFFLVLPLWALLDSSEIAGKLAAETTRADWGAILSNQVYYISALTFPWNTDSAVRYVTLLAYVGLVAYALIVRNYRLLFLTLIAPLSVMPLASFFERDSRFMYLPMMVPAAWIGIIVTRGLEFVQLHCPGRARGFLADTLVLLVIAFTVLSQGAETTEAAEGFNTLARQERLQFRPIYQQHRSFAPDTLLYFVEPPLKTLLLSGVMFLHYGANATVKGNDVEGMAGFRTYNASYVFYQDDQGVLKEQQVDQETAANVNPPLPVQLGSGISLDGFEVVNTRARPGEAIVLILYWRALHKIDKDYTVFAHLLDEKGAIISGYDSQPRRGNLPTTLWQPGHLVEDAIILPIGSDVPPGNDYHIEVGLYYLPTMERLPLFDGNQVTYSSSVIFNSFTVGP